jgi:hypothetical protein
MARIFYYSPAEARRRREKMKYVFNSLSAASFDVGASVGGILLALN